MLGPSDSSHRAALIPSGAGLRTAAMAGTIRSSTQHAKRPTPAERGVELKAAQEQMKADAAKRRAEAAERDSATPPRKRSR